MPASVSTATGRTFVGGAVSLAELKAGAEHPERAQGPVPAHLIAETYRPPVVIRAIPAAAVEQPPPPATPNERRLAGLRRYFDSLTPEQRQARIQRAREANPLKDLSPERRREIARKGAAATHSAPPEQRRARIEKARQTLLERGLSEEARLRISDAARRSQARKSPGERQAQSKRATDARWAGQRDARLESKRRRQEWVAGRRQTARLRREAHGVANRLRDLASDLTRGPSRLPRRPAGDVCDDLAAQLGRLREIAEELQAMAGGESR